MVRVLHIANLLYTGGAETMLARLAERMDTSRFETRVLSITAVGPIGERFREAGVSVESLAMRRGMPDPVGLARLVLGIRRCRPDVIQTWMYHADLLGGVAARLAGRFPVVWGIRHTNLDPREHKRTTAWTMKACARLSRRLASRIVCNSEAGLLLHAQLGYAADRMLVIHNGFDLGRLRPDAEARRSVREGLGIGAETPLIGYVARFHPQKDHRTFVRAAGMLRARRPEVRFLLCGREITSENAELAGWLREAEVAERCHLLGAREDVPRLTTALDLATCAAAYGESFPQVLGEAMACGVPCVTTDVGDSRVIVGDTGRTVAPGDPEALARAWEELLGLEPAARRLLGESARLRVQERYSLERIVGQYEELYASLGSGTRGAAGAGLSI